MIKPEDLKRNSIKRYMQMKLLLAYYIASVNIEMFITTYKTIV